MKCPTKAAQITRAASEYTFKRPEAIYTTCHMSTRLAHDSNKLQPFAYIENQANSKTTQSKGLRPGDEESRKKKVIETQRQKKSKWAPGVKMPLNFLLPIGIRDAAMCGDLHFHRRTTHSHCLQLYDELANLIT